jgi:phosphoenolpyruvate carboxykinase (GTP)
MKFGPDGRLYAVNGETGFFGVAPGTSMKSCPNGMLALNQHCIFTNTGFTQDGDVWWEGMTPSAPEGVTNWLGQPHDGKSMLFV